MHRVIKEVLHIYSQSVFVAHRKVKRRAIESIFQEWVQIIIQPFSDQLDMAAFHGAHEWRRPRQRHRINVNFIKLSQDSKCGEVARFGREMQSGAPDIIASVQVGLQL